MENKGLTGLVIFLVSFGVILLFIKDYVYATISFITAVLGIYLYLPRGEKNVKDVQSVQEKGA